eukprot:2368717-Amphidinium_carterae.1
MKKGAKENPAPQLTSTPVAEDPFEVWVGGTESVPMERHLPKLVSSSGRRRKVLDMRPGGK